MERIVVLGAGTGGTIVANKLYKKLKKAKKPYEITVVDADFKHVYQPGFLFTMLNRDETKNIVKDGRKLLPKKVKTVMDKVVKVDTKERLVILEKKNPLPYDYLVLATGARVAQERVDWWDDSIHHFYSPQAAERLWKDIESFNGGKILIAIGDLPYRCPPAPIEATFLLDDYFKKKKLRDKVDITYCSPLNRAFSIETVNTIVESLLKKKGIGVETYFNVDDVDIEEKVVYSLEGGEEEYDHLIMVPPHAAQPYIVESGIADGAGWVPTDRHTLRVKGQERIYALGDTTDIPTSKAGSTAHYEAQIIAQNIFNEVVNNGKEDLYDGHVQCFFLTEFGKSLFIDFNFENPPKPGKPRRFWWWFKLVFKPFYFRFVARGLV